MRQHQHDLVFLCPALHDILNGALRSTLTSAFSESFLLARQERIAHRERAPHRALDLVYPSGEYQVMEAWLMVVDEHLCKPDLSESQIWTHGLKQGRTSLLHTDVNPDEGPDTFARRLMETHATFVKYASEPCILRAL